MENTQEWWGFRGVEMVFLAQSDMIFPAPRGAWLFNITADYFPSLCLNFYTASLELLTLKYFLGLWHPEHFPLLNLFILHTCNRWSRGYNLFQQYVWVSVCVSVEFSSHVFSLFASQQHVSANSHWLQTLQSSCTPAGPQAYQRASWSPIATFLLESQEWLSGYPNWGTLGSQMHENYTVWYTLGNVCECVWSFFKAIRQFVLISWLGFPCKLSTCTRMTQPATTMVQQ